MKLSILEKAKSHALVFFSGFGIGISYFCDFFKKLDFNGDIVFVDNYFSFDVSILKNMRYESIEIMAFSMGVAIFSRLDLIGLPKIRHKIAINGTVNGICQDFGIHPKIFTRTCKNLDFVEFLSKIGVNSCHNNLDDELLKSELCEIYNFVMKNEIVDFSPWDLALISRNDSIFPFETQLKSWSMRSKVQKVVPSLHFCFNDDEAISSLKSALK